jgi:hypothetical protein
LKRSRRYAIAQNERRVSNVRFSNVLFAAQVLLIAIDMDDAILNARFAKLEDLLESGHGRLVESIAEVKDAFDRLEAGQASLVVRTTAIESRVTDVERTQRILLPEVRRLAARR